MLFSRRISIRLYARCQHLFHFLETREHTHYMLLHINFVCVIQKLLKNSIFIISQHCVTDFIPAEQPATINSIVDLYDQLPESLRRLIGHIEWPEPECLTRLAHAIQDGTVIGASDGSDRKNVCLSSHAWILQAEDGSELVGRGPVDGASPYRTIHRAELQGQTAIFLMLSLFVRFYGLLKCKINTLCDNKAVVTKMQKGWNLLRLRHTKGCDSDLQAILRTTLDNLKQTYGFAYTTDWVAGHQDDDADISSLPKTAALNIRMDAETKVAYELPQKWLTQECIPVYPHEGCAVYIHNKKITSALHTGLSEHWHAEDGQRPLEISQVDYALKKFSPHRRATAVKALHRHLPTQAKLYQQNRVTMSSKCPRCLSEDETAAHIYQCCNKEAIKQRQADWRELQKQLTKSRTSSIILRTWNEHLVPLLALPTSEGNHLSALIIEDDITHMLNYAVQQQAMIGWEKLLLGFGATTWKTLQEHIDARNPNPPSRSAEDWMNTAVYHLLKFFLRCWKSRNIAIYGDTKQEQKRIALEKVRERIRDVYAAPPQLDPQFRSIYEVPLAHRLQLPLQAAEQWISLIKHQMRVTQHNLKVLMRKHIPSQQHFRTMQQIARKQRYERRQPDSPRKAQRCAVQLAVKQMKEKLYSRRSPRKPRRCRDTRDGRRIVGSSGIMGASAITHVRPRYHPP